MVILQIPTAFQTFRRTALLLNVYGVSDSRHMEVQKAEPSVPDPSPLKLKLLFQS
jgi:hypothetical protein